MPNYEASTSFVFSYKQGMTQNKTRPRIYDIFKAINIHTHEKFQNTNVSKTDFAMVLRQRFGLLITSSLV